MRGMTVCVQGSIAVRASDQSCRVKGIGTALERCAMAGTTRCMAILGVRTRTPRSADSLRRNPLGIYIDAIDWTRELEPTETSPAPPAPAIISFGSPADPSPPAAQPSTREDPQ